MFVRGTAKPFEGYVGKRETVTIRAGPAKALFMGLVTKILVELLASVTSTAGQINTKQCDSIYNNVKNVLFHFLYPWRLCDNVIL